MWLNTLLKGWGEKLLVLVLNWRLDIWYTGKSAICSGWWGELCSDEGCGQDGMEHCIFLPSIPGTPYPDVAMLPGAGWDGLPPSCYPQEHAEHPILIIPIPIPPPHTVGQEATFRQKIVPVENFNIFCDKLRGFSRIFGCFWINFFFNLKKKNSLKIF